MRAAALLDLILPYRKAATLGVMMLAAAFIYVWWQEAARDRASLIAATDGICEAAGEPFRPEGRPKREWGLSCIVAVRRLRQMETDLTRGSLTAAIDAMEARAGKEATDAALAREAAMRTDQRVQRMEAADAAVQDDITTGDWAAAVNELGGLRNHGP
jgi:hypothetical protein